MGAFAYVRVLRFQSYVPVELQVTEKKRFDGFEMTIEVAQKMAESFKPYPSPVFAPAMAS